jgi:hypothetical protein
LLPIHDPTQVARADPAPVVSMAIRGVPASVG